MRRNSNLRSAAIPDSIGPSLNGAPTRPRATWTPLDLVQLLTLALRNWALLVAAGIVGMAVMLGVLVMLGPRYDVSAKILLRLGREMTAPAILNARDGGQVMPAAMRPEDIASEIEILSDPRLVTRVVEYFGEDFFADRPSETLWQHIRRAPKAALRVASDMVRDGLILLGLRQPISATERLTLAIAGGLRVEPVRRSDVILVQLSFPDPRAGTLLLEKYLEFALENHARVHRNSSMRASFMAERAARSAELRDAEARLMTARTERNAAWSAPEQQALLLRTEADLQLQQAQARSDAAQAQAEADNARRALTGLSPETRLSSVRTRNKSADDLRSRRVQLELELVTLRARYSDASPEVGDVRRQVEALDAVLKAEPEYYLDAVTTGANAQYEAVSRDLVAKQYQADGHRARADQLVAQLLQVREQVRLAQRTEAEIDQLQRDVQRLRRSVDISEKGLDDAATAETLERAEMSSLKVIMPPIADSLPAAPSLKRFMILGLLGGLALAYGAVVLREMLWPGARRGRIGPEIGPEIGTQIGPQIGTEIGAPAGRKAGWRRKPPLADVRSTTF